MKYILNTSTNTYHIEGCCHNSFSEKKVFNTENEVIKYGSNNQDQEIFKGEYLK